MMNKKINTLLFLIIATIFNVVVIFIIFIVGFILLGQFILPLVSAGVGQLLLIVLFCGALIAGYFIYSRTLRWINRRYDTTKFLAPLFKPRNRT